MCLSVSLYSTSLDSRPWVCRVAHLPRLHPLPPTKHCPLPESCNTTLFSGNGSSHFLPATPPFLWLGLGSSAGGAGRGAERREVSIQSRVNVARPGAEQYPQTPKGSRQEGLEGVGVCVLREHSHLQLWNWKDEYDHPENITQCPGPKVFVALSKRAMCQGTYTML